MLTKIELIEALQPIYNKLDILESGQNELKAGQKSLESRQKSLESRQKSLESGQKSLESGQKRIEDMLSQSIQDNAAFFNQTWAYIDELKHILEKKIDKIEKYVLHS